MARRRAVETPPSRTETVLKWVGRATALLTFIFAVVQLVRITTETRDRRRQVDELLRIEALQVKAADYAGAWASLDRALVIAESGGQLARLTGQVGADARRVRTAQEDLAMSWLQDLRVAAGGKYSPIVDPLGPVMTRGAAEATGARKADLLAHIAWATFHKSFDGLSIPDLTPQYKAALAEDPANPFAHAFLGHWIAWSDGSLPAATSEFEAALAANRARPFVRRLQAASLRRKGDTGNVMLIALINDMRRGGEGVDALLRSDAENVLAFSCGMREYPDRLRSLLAVTPAAEMVATSRALFSPDEAIRNESRLQHRRACLATFLEAAGQRDEALTEWRKLRDSIPAGQGFALRDRAEASVKRLGARQ